MATPDRPVRPPALVDQQGQLGVSALHLYVQRVPASHAAAPGEYVVTAHLGAKWQSAAWMGASTGVLADSAVGEMSILVDPDAASDAARALVFFREWTRGVSDDGVVTWRWRSSHSIPLASLVKELVAPGAPSVCLQFVDATSLLHRDAHSVANVFVKAVQPPPAADGYDNGYGGYGVGPGGGGARAAPRSLVTDARPRAPESVDLGRIPASLSWPVHPPMGSGLARAYAQWLVPHESGRPVPRSLLALETARLSVVHPTTVGLWERVLTRTITAHGLTCDEFEQQRPAAVLASVISAYALSCPYRRDCAGDDVRDESCPTGEQFAYMRWFPDQAFASGDCEDGALEMLLAYLNLLQLTDNDTQAVAPSPTLMVLINIAALYRPFIADVVLSGEAGGGRVKSRRVRLSGADVALHQLLLLVHRDCIRGGPESGSLLVDPSVAGNDDGHSPAIVVAEPTAWVRGDVARGSPTCAGGAAVSKLLNVSHHGMIDGALTVQIPLAEDAAFLSYETFYALHDPEAWLDPGSPGATLQMVYEESGSRAAGVPAPRLRSHRWLLLPVPGTRRADLEAACAHIPVPPPLTATPVAFASVSVRELSNTAGSVEVRNSVAAASAGSMGVGCAVRVSFRLATGASAQNQLAQVVGGIESRMKARGLVVVKIGNCVEIVQGLVVCTAVVLVPATAAQQSTHPR